MQVYVRNNNKNIRFVVPNLNKSFLFTITEKKEQVKTDSYSNDRNFQKLKYVY